MICCKKSNTPLIKRAKEIGVIIYTLKISKIINFDIFKLLRIIKEENVSLINAHAFGCMFTAHTVAIISRKNLIFSPHTIDMYNQFIFFFFKKTWALLSRFCKAIIVVSKKDKETLIARKIGRPDNIFTIYNTIKENSYRDKREHFNLKKTYNIDEDKKVIIQIGHLTRQKDPFAFLQIAEKINKERNDFHFMLIGDGNLKEKLLDYCQNNHINNVTFTGRVTNSADFFNQADLIVLTSLWEGLPYVLIEALFYGLTGVVSNVNGNGVIFIHGETGFTAPPKDIQTFKRYIYELIENDSLRKKFINNGQELVDKNFIGDTFQKETISVFTKSLT